MTNNDILKKLNRETRKGKESPTTVGLWLNFFQVRVKRPEEVGQLRWQRDTVKKAVLELFQKTFHTSDPWEISKIAVEKYGREK